IRKNDGRAEAAAVLKDFQRLGIEPARKGIVDEEARHEQQLRLVEILQTIALQGAEIIGIPELGTQSLEQGPVTIAMRPAELPLEVPAQVILYGIVVEQCVVDIEKEHERRGLRHAGDLAVGICHPTLSRPVPAVALLAYFTL